MPKKPRKRVLHPPSKILAALVVLFVLAAGAYGEMLRYFFTDVDTFSLINHGRMSGFRDLGRLLSTELMAGRMVNAIYFRPLTSITFGLAYHFFGLNPFGYHVLNGLLFWLTGVLLFATCRSIWPEKRGFWIGGLSAAFFLLHPLQVDNVPAHARLGDLLAGFFVALSIFLFAKFQLELKGALRKAAYVGAILAAFLGLCAKEPAIVAPVALFLIAVLFSGEREPRKRWRNAALLIVPLLVLDLIFVLWRQHIIGGMGGYISVRGVFGDSEILKIGFRFRTTVMGHLYGLGMTVLSDNYDRFAAFLMDRGWLMGLIFFSSLAAVARPVVRRGMVLFQRAWVRTETIEWQDRRGLWLFAGFLIAHAGLLFFTIFMPRYLYLATLPFACLLGLGTFRLFENREAIRKDPGPRLAWLFILLIIFFDSPLWSKERLRRWRTGGEITAAFLSEVEHRASEPEVKRLYLVNTPYVSIYGDSAPIFWELPFNQLLLEHAIVDYLDLKALETQRRYAEVVCLNYLYLKGDPAQLQVATTWAAPDTIEVTALNGAIPSPFPWSRIAGRDPHEHLYSLEGGRINFTPEPPEGWPKLMRIYLTPEALQVPAVYLAYGQGGLQPLAP